MDPIDLIEVFVLSPPCSFEFLQTEHSQEVPDAYCNVFYVHVTFKHKALYNFLLNLHMYIDNDRRYQDL